MKLLDLLQGKWLGHPLHPVVVHAAVGGWIVAGGLDLVLWWQPQLVVLARVAFYAVALGLAAAFLAVPTGVAEWAPIKKEKPAWKLGLLHMLLNLVATVVWAANLGLRIAAQATDTTITLAILVSSLVGAGLVLVSGYLGTLLVFDHGTSVGRQSKRKWRTIAERAGARVPEEK